jgi:hydrogenase maturation factor HypF (carbamoyltransferase family)
LTRNRKAEKDTAGQKRISMYLIPCSCGTTFAISEDYDRKGTHLRAYLICPTCGKRHDPKNRVLQLGYEHNGYWKVES